MLHSSGLNDRLKNNKRRSDIFGGLFQIINKGGDVYLGLESSYDYSWYEDMISRKCESALHTSNSSLEVFQLVRS